MKNNHLLVNFTKLIDFCYSLEQSNNEVWSDHYGSYQIIICKSDYQNILSKNRISNIFSSINIQETIAIDLCSLGNNVVSIGSFYEHDLAKKYCLDNNKSLITIPFPLSNDSFGTSRITGKNDTSSISGVFPKLTIFDLSIILNIPFSFSLLGVGEFIGLHFSIIDYCLVRNIPIPRNILYFIHQQINNLLENQLTYPDLFIKSLAIDLVFKCLLMRANNDHQLGCGIDHLFAGIIEKKCNLPHGKAVMLGSIISLQLFPSWQNYGYSISDLIEISNKLCIFSQTEIEKLLHSLKINQLIYEAINSRPNRPTMLNNVSNTRKIAWEKLN